MIRRGLPARLGRIRRFLGWGIAIGPRVDTFCQARRSSDQYPNLAEIPHPRCVRSEPAVTCASTSSEAVTPKLPPTLTAGGAVSRRCSAGRRRAGSAGWRRGPPRRPQSCGPRRAARPSSCRSRSAATTHPAYGMIATPARACRWSFSAGPPPALSKPGSVAFRSVKPALMRPAFAITPRSTSNFVLSVPARSSAPSRSASRSPSGCTADARGPPHQFQRGADRQALNDGLHERRADVMGDERVEADFPRPWIVSAVGPVGCRKGARQNERAAQAVVGQADRRSAQGDEPSRSAAGRVVGRVDLGGGAVDHQAEKRAGGKAGRVPVGGRRVIGHRHERARPCRPRATRSSRTPGRRRIRARRGPGARRWQGGSTGFSRCRAHGVRS